MQAEGDLYRLQRSERESGKGVAQRRSARNAVKEDWGYGLCARGAAPIRSSTEGALRGKGRTPLRRVADDRRSRLGDREETSSPHLAQKLSSLLQALGHSIEMYMSLMI